MARLDRLGPAKELAQIGAALGASSPTPCWLRWRRKEEIAAESRLSTV